MPSTRLILATLLAVCAPATAQTVLRSYDVSVLTRAPRGEGDDGYRSHLLRLPLELPLPTGEARGDGPYRAPYVDSLPTAGIRPDRLLELLEACLDVPVAGDSEHGREPGATLRDDRLWLRASAADHAHVAGLLAALERTSTRRVQYTLYALEPTAIGEPGVLDPAAVGVVIARHAAAPVQVGSVPLGACGAAHAGEFVPFVRDYDVEVAQKQKIADPKVDLVFDGLSLGVLAHDAGSGTVQLVFAARRTAVEQPVRARTLGANGLGAVQLPRAEVGIATGSAVLETGGGLLFGGNDGRGAWLLVVHAVDPEAAPTGEGVRTIALLPLGHVLQPALHPPMPLVRPRGPGFEESHAGDRTESLADARRAAAGAVNAALAGLGATDRHWTFGETLVLRGDAASHARARAELAALTPARTTATVRYRLGTVSADVARAITQSTELPAAVADQLTHRGQVACQVGAGFGLLAGRQTAYLRDYDVEIAHGASAGNPIIGRAFAGLVLHGVVAARTDGDLELSASYERAEVGADGSFDPAVGSLGTLDLPRTRYTEGARRFTFARGGGFQVLSLTPAGPNGAVEVLAVACEENPPTERAPRQR